MLIDVFHQQCPEWWASYVLDGHEGLMSERFEGIYREMGAVRFFVGDYLI